MSIQKFSNQDLLSMKLATKPGTPPPVAGESERRLQKLTMAERDGASFGVWEATVGSFARDVVAGEVMYILGGAAVFLTEGGDRFEMAVGDTLVFPPNTRGTWIVTEHLRKLYVLF